MPKILENCIKSLMVKGHSKDSAYAICVKSTGWQKKKGGGWIKKAAKRLRKAKKGA